MFWNKPKIIALAATAICLLAADAPGGSGLSFFATALADDGKPDQKEPGPEQKMQARFPQPVKVGHLIGLPVLDGGDSTIGYVQQVVRTPNGKIELIVPYAKHFGWARNGSLFDWGRRLVAVPIETVAILALQIDALDMEREAFDRAPTWSSKEDSPIPPEETIKIAVQRR